MKKITLCSLVFLITLIPMSMLNFRSVYSASSPQIRIDTVNRTITPMYGGVILINDTFKVSSISQSVTTERFPLGIPIKYKSNLIFIEAYEPQEPTKKLDLVLNTGLGVIGFYSFSIVLTSETQDLLNEGNTYSFIVTYLLTNLIEHSTKAINETTEHIFTMDIPIYPSLDNPTTECNTTIILPKDTEPASTNVLFNLTNENNQYLLNHLKSPLPEYSEDSEEISFSTDTLGTFALFNIKKFTREIIVYPLNEVYVSEEIIIKSNTESTINSIRLYIPENATEIAPFNEQGNKLSFNPIENETDLYEVPLPLIENQSRSLKVTYSLLNKHQDIRSINEIQTLTLSAFEQSKIVPEIFVIRISFPEGATLKSFPQNTFNFRRDVFQETLSVVLNNVTWLQNEDWIFTYTYSIFWNSFRPTLWVSVLVVIGSVIAVIWRKPKEQVQTTFLAEPREELDEFVNVYEQKNKIKKELEEIQQKTKKGKVSRRRYKIKKTTLDNKSSTLTKRLTELSQKIMVSSTKHADVMRQLELGETELDNIEADIRRIEVRFKRGEISAQTYRRLLEDDLRRREKAKIKIDGALLRLRE